MPHADQKYIDALLTNDPLLLNELYQKFAGKVKSLITTNGGTETDARDIFQEALLSIYKKAKASGLVLDCPLDAFLYVVCRNKWKTEISKRRLGRVTFQDTEGYSAEEIGMPAELEKEQKQAELFQKKLTALGDACRRLLLLSWQKRDLQEVAAMLQMTYGYARKKKSECMARLIGLIKTDPEFENLKH